MSFNHSTAKIARVLNGYGVQFFFLRLGDGDASGAPNKDMVQNHLTKHCWAYFSIQTVDIGIFLSPKNFSSVRIS